MNLTLAKALDRYLGILLCRILAGIRVLRAFLGQGDRLVEARTVLLVKFWGLGNVVLLLPVIAAIRRRYPSARLVFVSLARNREILDACPDLDRRIYVDDRGAPRLLATLLGAFLRARGERPDLCIDFEQFARTSALLAVFAGARQIVGLDTPGQGRSILYHKPVRYDDRQHMGQTYLDLARAAGVPDRLYRPSRIPFSPSHEAEARAVAQEARRGAGGGPLVVLHPGSGDNFQGRRWPAENFTALADRLVADLGAGVVVTGGPAEVELAARIAGASRHPQSVVSAAGRISVLGLAALIQEADLLVTNDTAPVHMGSACGTPVFAFFGPNTPRLYGPLSRGSYAFYRALPCSPCLTNMNYKTSLCRMPVCIRDIEVDEVFERIRSHRAERDETASAEASTGSGENVLAGAG